MKQRTFDPGQRADELASEYLELSAKIGQLEERRTKVAAEIKTLGLRYGTKSGKDVCVITDQFFVGVKYAKVAPKLDAKKLTTFLLAHGMSGRAILNGITVRTIDSVRLEQFVLDKSQPVAMRNLLRKGLKEALTASPPSQRLLVKPLRDNKDTDDNEE